MSNETQKSYLPSDQAMVELLLVYLLKFMLVFTGCLVFVGAAAAYFLQHYFLEKQLVDIKDVILVGGAGFGVALKFYFGEVKTAQTRNPKNGAGK